MFNQHDCEPIIYITIQKVYRYDGILFEYDRNKPFAPWPLRKDFEPKKKAGWGFYERITDFLNLSAEEQERFRWGFK